MGSGGGGSWSLIYESFESELEESESTKWIVFAVMWYVAYDACFVNIYKFSFLIIGGRKRYLVFTHILLIIHWAGLSLVRHRQNVFASLGLSGAMKEGMSRGCF